LVPREMVKCRRNANVSICASSSSMALELHQPIRDRRDAVTDRVERGNFELIR